MMHYMGRSESLSFPHKHSTLIPPCPQKKPKEKKKKMQPSTLALIIALAITVSADFLASNTTVCMGAFPFNSCHQGVVVFSGTNNETDYTCAKLTAAEDESYITNGTMSHYGSAEVWSDDVCGHGKLRFLKDGLWGYYALDERGVQVAGL